MEDWEYWNDIHHDLHPPVHETEEIIRLAEEDNLLAKHGTLDLRVAFNLEYKTKMHRSSIDWDDDVDPVGWQEYYDHTSIKKYKKDDARAAALAELAKAERAKKVRRQKYIDLNNKYDQRPKFGKS